MSKGKSADEIIRSSIERSQKSRRKTYNNINNDPRRGSSQVQRAKVSPPRDNLPTPEKSNSSRVSPQVARNTQSNISQKTQPHNGYESSSHSQNSGKHRKAGSTERKPIPQPQESRKSSESVVNDTQKQSNSTSPLYKENSKDSNSKQTVKDRKKKKSRSKTSEPTENNKAIKKKKSVLTRISLVLLLVIVSFGSIVGAISYGVYRDSAQNKMENNAYRQGVEDTKQDPNIDNVVKMDNSQLTQLITTAPGASFPNNAVLKNIQLQGWSQSGGQIREGKASLSMCYTGDGITTPLKASAFIVSEDASIPHPQWSVDSVSVTGEKCSKN